MHGRLEHTACGFYSKHSPDGSNTTTTATVINALATSSYYTVNCNVLVLLARCYE